MLLFLKRQIVFLKHNIHYRYNFVIQPGENYAEIIIRNEGELVQLLNAYREK